MSATLESPTSDATTGADGGLVDPSNARDGNSATSASKTLGELDTGTFETEYRSTVETAKQRGFVGVEIDWEVTISAGLGSPNLQLINNSGAAPETLQSYSVTVARETKRFMFAADKRGSNATQAKVRVKVFKSTAELGAATITATVYEMRLITVARGEITVQEG